jgi:hypothetical protein
MDPVEDMAEKKISPPRSFRAAIHHGKNMASGVTIRCHGDGSNIGDYKLSLTKSRLQPKSQGWARLSKVLKIVAKSKGQVGKSKLVVVFSFLEADGAKPRTRSCTTTSRSSGKHYICRQMALSESGLQGCHRSRYTNKYSVYRLFPGLGIFIKLLLWFKPEQIISCTIKAKMLVSGIRSWYFLDSPLLKPVTICGCNASQLPAPDWRFSHRWWLTFACHTALSGR